MTPPPLLDVLPPGNTVYSPVLWDSQGTPMSVEGSLLAPHALNFASVFQQVGKLYLSRWDEALRDNTENALAMKRDTFYLSLLQERTAPTINLEWEVEVDNEDDPEQAQLKAGLNQVWRDVPDKPGLITALLERLWYGRAGAQLVWGKQDSGLIGTTFHEPVNGDSIQFAYDNTPVILISWYTAQRLRATDPQAIVPATDRGAYGLRLYKPEYRRRFIISKNVRSAADYFEGELAGGIHGVGFRSWIYWGDHMRRNVLAATLNWMFSTGMADILMFNYPSGNAEAEKKAVANAKKITGKVAITCPRDPKGNWSPIEQIPMNASGVDVLMRVVREYYDVHAERLIVGQSMSSGGGGKGGLEGDGRADFAKDTKYELIKTDVARTAEVLTTDWLIPARDYNYPGSKIPVRMRPILADKDAVFGKLERGLKLVQAGVPVAEAELRRAAGFREPKPGEKVVGGQSMGQPGANGLNPSLPAGHKPGESPAGPKTNSVLPAGQPADKPPPNPALPAGKTAGQSAPNAALPPGDKPPTTPNPVLPTGTGQLPAQPVDPEQAADEISGLIGVLNQAFGINAGGNRDAILAAVKAHQGTGQPTTYRFNACQDRASDGRFGHQAGQHDGGGQQTGSDKGAGEGQPQSPQPVGGGDELSSLAEEFPEEASDPTTWERVKGYVAKAREEVWGYMVRMTPHIIPLGEAILDTPEDLSKFGFAPTLSGTASGNAHGDPLREQLGIGTHLACSIAAKVLAAAWVRGKRAIGYDAASGLLLGLGGTLLDVV